MPEQLLANMDNLTRGMIREMARATETELTATHLRVLAYADAYYRRHQVGPLYANIAKHLGVERTELERMFPHGLMSVYAWVGIPVHSPEQGCKPIAVVNPTERREVYFDYQATTPVRDEVQAVLRRYYSGNHSYANPSSATAPGKQAHELIEKARLRLATCLAVDPQEILFVSGGSEANNMAIKGLAWRKLAETGHPGHLVTSALEHPSVLNSLRFLQTQGFTVTEIQRNREGVIAVEDVRAALRPDTLLVAIMAVNNEIGTINPLAQIGACCAEAGVAFLVDGVQGFGKIPLHPRELGISMLSISGHKLYAPKGVGALFVDKSIELTPLLHGGLQEAGRRAGTENVGAIIALGAASQLAVREMRAEQARLADLQAYFLAKLRHHLPRHLINGSLRERVANNLNVGFPDVDGGSLLLSLNAIGIYASSGSACHAGSNERSHVLNALGGEHADYGSIRFGFGLQTVKQDIDYLFEYMPSMIEQLQQRKNVVRGQ